MRLHNISVNARYEARLLRRSWLFRAFALLALFVISVLLLFNNTSVIDRFSGAWSVSALPCEIPFAAIYYYNFAQAAILVFLAGTFLKKGQKLDTTEVLMVRPMSNSDYIFGKVVGIFEVFSGLNIIVLLLAAFINLLVNRSPFAIYPYIFYFLTISIPTLLFVLGLSFTAINIIKSQAVTFVILLGLIGLDSFYLTEKFYGIFDIFGTNIPTIFSEITGMADMRSFLLHRLCYLLIGVGLIFTTITFVDRLPDKRARSIMHFIVGVIFILFGLLTGLTYVSHFEANAKSWSEYVDTFKRYASETPLHTESNDIEFSYSGGEMEARSTICIVNDTRSDVEEIILYLNPGLEISSLTDEEGVGVEFSRDNQVISLHRPLVAGDTVVVTLAYSGTIDENVCYADVRRELIDSTKNNGVQRYGKHYAYMEDNMVLLTPETMWYPTTMPPSNPLAKYHIMRDFTWYSLKIPDREGVKVITQGYPYHDDTLSTTFEDDMALTGISLAIGNYNTKSITVDGIEYEIDYLGDDFFSKYFTQINDTLPALIREYLADLESTYGVHYPFDKLIFAETPIHFASYARNWKGSSEYLQPEIVFIPERGIVNGIELERTYSMMKEMSRRTNLTDETSLECSLLQRGFVSTLTEETNSQPRDWESASVNLHLVTPLFSSFTRYIYSYNYPIFDISLTMLQTLTSSTSNFRFWEGIINNKQRANLYLETHSFQQATRDTLIDAEIFYELLKLKATELKMYMLCYMEESEYEQFLDNFFANHEFFRSNISEFTEAFEEEFGIDLLPFLDHWYTAVASPELLSTDILASKVEVEDATEYLVEFKIYNPSPHDAVISAKVAFGGGRQGGPGMAFPGMGGGQNSSNNDLTYYYQIPAETAWHCKILSESQPSSLTLSYNIAKNLPTESTTSFSKIDDQSYDTVAGLFPILPDAFSMTLPGETIIDNDSPNFSIISSNSKTRLKDLFKSEDEEKYHNFSFWRAPSQWKLTAGDFCYGDVVKSAYYKRKGSGQNRAQWLFNAEEAGYYEISIWVGNSNAGMPPMGREQRRTSQNQYYTISNSEWIENTSIDMRNVDQGWYSLGSFDLPEGVTTVTLSDRSERNYVIADAIKFTEESNSYRTR